MRTVSFSDKKIKSIIKEKFVATFTNTKGDPSSGASFSHSPNDSPGPCGKAAGRQNVQCIFATRAGEIFHVAGGFQSSEDLLKELSFANKLYSEIKESKDPKRTVVDTHVAYLKQNGFSENQIQSGQVGMFNENMPNFSPKDLGIDLPGGVPSQFFDQMGDYRTLADHRYVVMNPLIKKSEFENAPEKLVGKQKSFFGSNSAMNSVSSDFFKDVDMIREKNAKAVKDLKNTIPFNFGTRNQRRGIFER